MSSLSQKDKNTLIIAGIALLIVGIIILGIKPTFTSISETKATNAELSAQKQTMKTEIEALPTYQTNLETAKSNYATSAAKVFACTTCDLVHDDVVALAEGQGLSIESLSFGEAQTLTVAEYKIVEGDEITTEGGTTDGTVQIVNVQVSVSGTNAQILSFLDMIRNDEEGIFLDSVTFSTSEDVTSVSFTFDIVVGDTFE